MLQAIDGQRDQGDDKSPHYPRRDHEGTAAEKVQQPQADACINQSNKKDPPTAESFPTEGHEQAHSPYGDQAAQIIKDMGQVEAWGVLV